MPDLSQIRREYLSSGLEMNMLDKNPFIQFRKWVDDAIRAGVSDPTAMSLSTATLSGKPSSRMMLLKDIDDDGLTFFTSYESRKAMNINDNPFGAILFFWPDLERQVRMEGRISKVTTEKSDEYFISRPRGGKIGAWASPQSLRIPDRKYLENLQRDYLKLFKTRSPGRPPHWGGYKLFPGMFEFWQGRENRLHDRFEYTVKDHSWDIHRLAP